MNSDAGPDGAGGGGYGISHKDAYSWTEGIEPRTFRLGVTHLNHNSIHSPAASIVSGSQGTPLSTQGSEPTSRSICQWMRRLSSWSHVVLTLQSPLLPSRSPSCGLKDAGIHSEDEAGSRLGSSLSKNEAAYQLLNIGFLRDVCERAFVLRSESLVSKLNFWVLGTGFYPPSRPDMPYPPALQHPVSASSV